MFRRKRKSGDFKAEIVPALLEEIERFVADKTAGVDTSPKEIAPEPAPATDSSFPIMK